MDGGKMGGLNTKKSLGQHWLNDVVSLRAMLQAADVQKGDYILEIGPGTGSLTVELLEKGARVRALEIDTEAVVYLEREFADALSTGQLIIDQGDIRTYNLISLPERYKLVANIPYYLTSHLLQLLSETKRPPQTAALLVQKEVAERVCAQPGDMSILSVTVQFYWHTNIGRVVPAKLFTPPPKVDSQILILERRPESLFEVDAKNFFKLVKSGFSAKRKTLLNSLSGGLRLNKEQTMDLLVSADIPPEVRAQALSLEQWYALYVSARAASLI